MVTPLSVLSDPGEQVLTRETAPASGIGRLLSHVGAPATSTVDRINPRSMIFFFGASEFGGHEMMAANIMIRVASETAITPVAICSQHAERLRQHLGSCNSEHPIAVHTYPFALPRFQSTLCWLIPHAIIGISRQLARMPGRTLVVVAGAPEESAVGVLAGRLAGKTVHVYVPFGRNTRLRRGRGWWLRDLMSKPFLHLPASLITILESERKALIAAGADSSRVSVFQNFLAEPWNNHAGGDDLPDALVRARDQLPADRFTVGIIGRIHFKQKGQDWLVDAIAAHRDRFAKACFFIIGDGADLPRLRARIDRLGLADRVRLVPWIRMTPAVYGSFDLVCLPSWYEGCPLVLIESVLSGTPVLASRTGMVNDYLPEACTFAVGNASEFVAKLDAAIRGGRHGISEGIREKFVATFLRDHVGSEFASLPAFAQPSG
jgi:glycosyltransferase involved in cell wall biosynthesis